VPSALREECISYLEKEISQYGIDVQYFKQKCVPNRVLIHYSNIEYKPTEEAFYVYWLSLVNCSIAVNNNSICFNFCQAPFFKKNKDSDGAGIYKLSIKRMADVCFEYAKDFFDSKQQNETFHLQLIMHDYSFFQHFNHALSKVNKDKSTFFPTLALDWTWNYNIAENFAGIDGNVLSISWEAYEAWNPTKRYTVCHLPSGENKIPVFGFETYFDTPPWNKYDWYSIDNNLMIEQEGAVIFWPWKYSIDQLLTNALGKVFDFKLEK